MTSSQTSVRKTVRKTGVQLKMCVYHILYVAVKGNTHQHQIADSREVTGNEKRDGA